MAALPQYLWIAVLGGICGFFYAFGIGANDVANAFASTVASKSLTLKQAVIVAGIFEFLGALLLGASVTTTIRSKIFDPELYADEPDIVLLGMFTSLLTGTIMLLGATYFALPVSTTHTIVGAIMGFSIVAKGFSSINSKVVVQIIISWIVSPLISGIISFIFFGLIRKFIMKTEHAFNRAYNTFPVVLFFGIGIDLFYILFKGMNNTSFADKLTLQIVIPVAFGVGAVCGLIWLYPVGPWAKRRVAAHFEERAAQQLEKDKKAEARKSKKASANVDEEEIDTDELYDVAHGIPVVKKDVEMNVDITQKAGDSEESTPSEDAEAAERAEEMAKKSYLSRMSQKFADNTYGQDLHAQSMHESSRANEIWDAAEKYDEDAEQLFTYLQVFTACLNSFAHGANDVSNAIAPLSAIIYIYQTGEVESKSPVQKWVLAYGGIAIVFGLLIYGYKVMKSIGYKLSALSPSRGASAELAASLFVVTASFIGIPVSSTQCIVGAVSGVGLVGGVKNVQWLFLARVAVGWAMVFLFAALLSAGLFGMFAFSPSLTE